MSEYRVELENYSGPLDLLLYLVKRHEIDLHDIPIAQLTDQYIAYLEKLRRVDINVAGEFLVMAATLLEIKSRMIMPQAGDDDEQTAESGQDAADGEAGEGSGMSTLDPRYELVQQLLAYKRFKDAATELSARREQWSRRFEASAATAPPKPAGTGAGEDDEAEPDNAPSIELELDDVSVFDLCEAFARILATIGDGPRDHAVVDDDTPIALHQEDILDRLNREGPLTLQRIFEGRNRSEMVGLFIATLELVRQRRLRVFQDHPGDEIQLEALSREEQAVSEDDEATSWRDPETGEIDYEWPSEEARRRAERRARRRASYAARRAAGEQGEDEDDDLEGLDDLGPEDEGGQG